MAIDPFQRSIDLRPTAEVHTFLDWSLGMLERYQQAIDHCRVVIRLDPDLVNHHNDVGVYLIELGRTVEVVPWSEKAIAARRYCCSHFPHFNMGRVRLLQGRTEEARGAFERAREHDLDHLPGRHGLKHLRRAGGEPA